MTSDGEHICLSGGAIGSDDVFGQLASAAGHTVIHFIFDGHKTTVPKDQRCCLTRDMLLEAEPYLIKANDFMKRSFPTKSNHTNSLLRRNWYQVRDTERVYAISTIKNGIVQGGTAWATTMFLQRYEMNACECYVFDQTTVQWLVWSGAWTPIIRPPAPYGIWTGIGTRKITSSGIKAASSLFMG